MIDSGIIIGWLNICFSFLRESVTSVPELYSPPESVLGIAIILTFGARNGPGRGPSGVETSSNPSRPDSSVIPCSRHIRTILAASTTDPPPTATIKSAFASAASAVAVTADARVVCCGTPSKVPAYLLPSALRIFSISSVCVFSVLLTMRKTRLASRFSASSRKAWPAGFPKIT